MKINFSIMDDYSIESYPSTMETEYYDYYGLKTRRVEICDVQIHGEFDAELIFDEETLTMKWIYDYKNFSVCLITEYDEEIPLDIEFQMQDFEMIGNKMKILPKLYIECDENTAYIKIYLNS